ncbi:hypothetical protein SKAU_G00084860 [Synaphobranchus kaupii]|uniref:Nectin cell adhesion molecule 3 n=1 Tax=Synaphobranchus kaupii TaxID=118154 RepID=A0A9Q1FWD5_SYNKA|nr:hypothetical protein SKAU_G00084860 [Synaphobranchus kaupii]
MAVRMSFHCHRSTSIHIRMKATFLLLFFTVSGVGSNQVVVSEKVNAVLGKNITLGCRVEVGANLSLTQSSWERRLPSGTVTLAVFNPQFGISIAPEYEKRLYFHAPSASDATIVLEDVGFADSGVYTCKVATFPLGNTQASTTVRVMVEPKVYVSAGSMALLDGGNETVVATCTAERGRPRAEVSWESELFGRSEVHDQDEPNGTTTSQARYLWRPNRHAQGHTLTCVVRHPALQTEFRIPYVLNSPPDVVLTGYDGNWFVGRETVKLQCRVHANPPAHYLSWTRVGGQIPEGAEVANGTLVFARPLERNDSGEYRCEAVNDLGRRSKEVHVQIQEPPPTTTTTLPTTAAPVSADTSTGALANKRGPRFSSPTLASLTDSSLGTIVGGAVGGVLFLVLLLVLGGVCYMRQRRTFRGDYYTKQYLGPTDMQKESQLDVLQPHELQEVYGDGSGKGSQQDLKPKPGDVIYPDYPADNKDREEWGDNVKNSRRVQREEDYYPDQHSPNNVHPRGPTTHTSTVNNGSPYMPEDCYDNGTDSDYVSHLDGSVISRRECTKPPPAPLPRSPPHFPNDPETLPGCPPHCPPLMLSPWQQPRLRLVLGPQCSETSAAWNEGACEAFSGAVSLLGRTCCLHDVRCGGDVTFLYVPQTSPTSSVAVAGAVIGAVLALFLITVFTIVLLTPRNSRPPTYMDKVIDLPPTHKPPPAYTERAVGIPLALNTAQVYYPSQVRRGGRLSRMSEDAYTGAGRRETPVRIHEPLSYQEWICHLNGADRVYVNHREHYV